MNKAFDMIGSLDMYAKSVEIRLDSAREPKMREGEEE